jgi:hypothetical protein
MIASNYPTSYVVDSFPPSFAMAIFPNHGDFHFRHLSRLERMPLAGDLSVQVHSMQYPHEVKSLYLNSHWEGHNRRKPMFDNPLAYASRSYVARKRTSSPIKPRTYLPRVTIPIYQYLHLPLLTYVPSKADVILPEMTNVVEVVDHINHALSPVYAPHFRWRRRAPPLWNFTSLRLSFSKYSAILAKSPPNKIPEKFHSLRNFP